MGLRQRSRGRRGRKSTGEGRSPADTVSETAERLKEVLPFFDGHTKSALQDGADSILEGVSEVTGLSQPVLRQALGHAFSWYEDKRGAD